MSLFELILQTNGYDAKGFIDPFSALEEIEEHSEQYNLVLADYKMYPISGCELARRVNEINDRIKVIIITALNSIGDNTLNLPIFIKPLNARKIIEIVHDNL
jgi:DNA-binding NtrC family response regulator